MREIVSIAGIRTDIEADIEVEGSEEFLPFLCDGSSDYTVFLNKVSALKELSEPCLYRDMNFEIYHDQNCGYIRRFYDKDKRQYGESFWKDKRNIVINYIEDGRSNIDHLRGIFHHIGLEKILIEHDRMILHAACVKTGVGGILFSGPSGIGKSTQADLWQQYEKAELINGDRPIIGKADHGWKAYGSPYAGSSRCHINDSVPIKAIVMLQQSEDCKLKRLSLGEAFRKILGQITVNQWDEKAMDKASRLVMQLIQEIPVYEMHCRPDRAAVLCLKEGLLGEC